VALAAMSQPVRNRSHPAAPSKHVSLRHVIQYWSRRWLSRREGWPAFIPHFVRYPRRI